MNKLINFILFQIGWFGCVLGGAHQFPWGGTVLSLGIVGFHLFRSDNTIRELRVIASAVFLGFVFDGFLVYMRFLDYPSGILISGTAPHWILSMWAVFATTLNLSLGWLQKRYITAFIFGLFGGPAAYLGGSSMGGVIFLREYEALLSLAVIWAVSMPLLIWISRVAEPDAGEKRVEGEI